MARRVQKIFVSPFLCCLQCCVTFGDTMSRGSSEFQEKMKNRANKIAERRKRNANKGLLNLTIGFIDWRTQISNSFFYKGSRSSSVFCNSIGARILHGIFLPIKFLIAVLVPPVSLSSGFLTLLIAISLLFITMTVIADFTRYLACGLNISSRSAALIFVGTMFALPDLFSLGYGKFETSEISNGKYILDVLNILASPIFTLCFFFGISWGICAGYWQFGNNSSKSSKIPFFYINDTDFLFALFCGLVLFQISGLTLLFRHSFSLTSHSGGRSFYTTAFFCVWVFYIIFCVLRFDNVLDIDASSSDANVTVILTGILVFLVFFIILALVCAKCGRFYDKHLGSNSNSNVKARLHRFVDKRIDRGVREMKSEMENLENNVKSHTDKHHEKMKEHIKEQTFINRTHVPSAMDDSPERRTNSEDRFKNIGTSPIVHDSTPSRRGGSPQDNSDDRSHGANFQTNNDSHVIDYSPVSSPGNNAYKVAYQKHDILDNFGMAAMNDEERHAFAKSHWKNPPKNFKADAIINGIREEFNRTPFSNVGEMMDRNRNNNTRLKNNNHQQTANNIDPKSNNPYLYSQYGHHEYHDGMRPWNEHSSLASKQGDNDPGNSLQLGPPEVQGYSIHGMRSKGGGGRNVDVEI